ncbi:fimbrillin family protein [Xylanibacter oryzae]|uniref:fimbrillin family protein n=1 Tax=Xylanibacter oryzae TaxID=185293 RepID=UPI0004BB31A5|nr:fimbrillin family protein [Xylanibacter oryzae]
MSRKFERNKYADSLYSLYLLLIASLCICSCTSENSIFDNDNTKLLNFSVSVPEWKNNDSVSNSKTRATPISGSSFDKASSFNIIADAYDGTKNYSTIINNEAVSYTNNMWQTTAPHYWPGTTTKTVSFYAYYPASIYSSISHTAGSAPTLSYTVPDKVSDQIDIMTATGNNVSGNTNSSTPLAFNHIFAAVQFCVGSAGMPTGTITGIALNNILYKGTYSLNGTWIQDATSKKAFSQIISFSTNTSTTITTGATTFMMMPQTLGSDASITITYSNGGTLTKSISGNWEAGKIYTYNISKTISLAAFDYTGGVQTYTVPLTGTYKLEVWGAEGGYNTTSLNGGKGGYSFGNIKLNGSQIIYIQVGGSGNIGNGYNGGGLGQAIGGGATHMSTSSGLLNTMSTNILIVAGGGGGATDGYVGGDGGGISGSDGVGVHPNASTTGKGGTQTFGGSGGTSTNYGIAASGGFGYGGSGVTSNESGPGGGGGWYGGGGTPVGGGAGGGSGHLSQSLISGTTGMQNGIRSGNGYARITFISAN